MPIQTGGLILARDEVRKRLSWQGRCLFEASLANGFAAGIDPDVFSALWQNAKTPRRKYGRLVFRCLLA